MEPQHAPASNLREATKTFLKVGLLSFGGPVAQIALMHQIFVEEKKWLDEKQYLSALNFCMLLPGPEAMQLSTYIGWRMYGVMGGLIAGLLFVLPGAGVIFILALLYTEFSTMSWMGSAFIGIKATVLIIVVGALMRVSKKALERKSHWIIAGFAFIGIFIFELPYPLIIAVAALIGFSKKAGDQGNPNFQMPQTSWRQSLKTLCLWLAIWLTPLLLIGLATGWGFLYELALFFSKLATVTFGGAYAVLAYMSQEVVFDFGWLTTAQMMDGLGLAETTPGPLILITEFVGFIAGFERGGIMLAAIATIIVLWMTFAPCFLWIFVGAPYIEWISAQPRLKNALSAITATVVGVILSLSIWFALHVLFQDIHKTTFGPLHIWIPNLHSANLVVLALAGISYILLIIRHIHIIYVLIFCALAAIGIEFLMPSLT